MKKKCISLKINDAFPIQKKNKKASSLNSIYQMQRLFFHLYLNKVRSGIENTTLKLN